MKKSETFILSANLSAEPTPALVVGQGLPTEILGEPVHYVWKDLLKVGEYRHPIKADWTLSITPERLDRWVENFDAMKAGGFKPFVPTKHQDFDAKDNLGWLVELKREGDTLKGLHQLIGDDAKLAAARNESSLCFRSNFRGNDGTVYDEVIEHNALCPDPVITGLGGFVALSKSGGADEGRAPVFKLAIGACDMDGLGKLRDFIYAADNLAMIKATLGLAEGDTISEADILDKMIEYVTKLRANATGSAEALSVSAAKVTELETKVTELTTRATAAEQKATEAETKVTQLSRTIDPDALEALQDAVKTRRDVLVDKGILTPAVADKLLTRLTKTKDGKANAVALSRAAGGGDVCLALGVFDDLKDLTPPPATGTQTGVQTLSRSTPGEDKPAAAGENPLLSTAEQMYGKDKK